MNHRGPRREVYDLAKFGARATSSLIERLQAERKAFEKGMARSRGLMRDDRDAAVEAAEQRASLEDEVNAYLRDGAELNLGMFPTIDHLTVATWSDLESGGMVVSARVDGACPDIVDYRITVTDSTPIRRYLHGRCLRLHADEPGMPNAHRGDNFIVEARPVWCHAADNGRLYRVTGEWCASTKLRAFYDEDGLGYAEVADL